LPNYGIDYYISLQTIQETMGKIKTTVSISGKMLDDNLQMLEKISTVVREQRRRQLAVQQTNQDDENQHIIIAAVELNLACPNIVGRPTIGYDFEQMEDVLHRVSLVLLPCLINKRTFIVSTGSETSTLL
jgi:dihydroorotate dehydrogenase (fumarate)